MQKKWVSDAVKPQPPVTIPIMRFRDFEYLVGEGTGFATSWSRGANATSAKQLSQV